MSSDQDEARRKEIMNIAADFAIEQWMAKNPRANKNVVKAITELLYDKRKNPPVFENGQIVYTLKEE